MPTGVYIRQPNKIYGTKGKHFKIKDTSKMKVSNNGWFKKGEHNGKEFEKGFHPIHQFKKGEPSVFLGKKRLNISGKNHWNWKDGKTPENLRIKSSAEYYLWRKEVFIKDKFICQKCGDNKGGNLTAHHIQNFSQYPELILVVSNGITFCKDCHILFHKIYGKKNNNKEQIKEFLNNKVGCYSQK
jgi:hypothetical protein